MHNTPIDARDVPVNETYITTLKGIPGITVFAKSKWMNCVYVRGNLQDLDAIEDLDFVTYLEYADKRLNLVPIPGSSTKDKLSVENKADSLLYDYGSATNQVDIIATNYFPHQDYTGAVVDSAVHASDLARVVTN